MSNPHTTHRKSFGLQAPCLDRSFSKVNAVWDMQARVHGFLDARVGKVYSRSHKEAQSTVCGFDRNHKKYLRQL